MKDNKSGWQFPKALEIIKCKEGNKEFIARSETPCLFANTRSTTRRRKSRTRS